MSSIINTNSGILLTTQDSCHSGIIHKIEDGEDLELWVDLGNSEDTAEWERQSDANINELGFRRMGPWTDDGTTVEAIDVSDLRGMVAAAMDRIVADPFWGLEIDGISSTGDTVRVASGRMCWVFTADDDGVRVTGSVDGEGVAKGFRGWNGVGHDGGITQRMTFADLVDGVVQSTIYSLL